MSGFTAKAAIALFFIFCFFSSISKAQWQPVFGVSNLEIHALYSEGNAVMAGGSHRKVLYSSDRGHTWRNLSLGLPAGHENIKTLLAYEKYLWIAVPGLGIRRSADGGVSWDWANDGLESFHIHALIAEEGTLLAGTDAGLFVSTDKANHWQPLHVDSSAPAVSALFAKGGKIYAGTAKGELYYSGNQGKNWQMLTSEVLRRPIRSIAVKNQTIYVGTLGQGVYHSSDGGKSWNTVKNGLGSVFVHDLALDDNRVLAATDAGLYFLEDGTNQWKKLDGMDKGEVNATYALHVQSHHIYAGTSHQGVLRSSDSGLHWETAPSGAMQQNIQVIFDGEGQLYAGIDNSIYTSTEGEQWQKAPGLPGKVRHFTAVGEHLFAATDAGIYRKLSNEVQWTLASTPVQATCMASLRDEVFAGTQFGIFKSTDGGDTWNSAGLPEENILTLATAGEHLLAGTRQGIYRSGKQGEHWEKVLGNEAVVTLKEHKNKILSGTKTALFLSSDAGKSWEPVAYDLYTYGIKNIITLPEGILIHDNAGRFFVSYDEGKKWSSYNLPVLGNISALAVYKGQFIAGTTDKGIWQHALLPAYEDKKEKESFSVYPNPASEKVLLSLPVLHKPFTISLKDVYGRTLIQQQSSSHEYTLGISHLPKGTYYLQISGNGKQAIRRIIKQE